MKYFVVTDVHGFFNQMKQALDAAGFDPQNVNHTLVSLGDLLDRGSQARECLEYVLGLERKILICGNHEDLMEDAIARHQFLSHDISNGTADTAIQLTGEHTYDTACLMMRNCNLYNRYCNELYEYYETQRAVFVHGWIPCKINKAYSTIKSYEAYEDWREATSQDWVDARWTNGMDAWQNGIRDSKTIFCGHWHSSWGHAHIHHICKEWENLYSTTPEHRIFHSEPFVDNGIVALDACTAHSHKVNVYVWEDEPLTEGEWS